jgi:nucleotide-binding universal stress UspA family protein
VENVGRYVSTVFTRTFHLVTFGENEDWLKSWTLFYWGWWIAWAPFVGMFVARVSRGRTIREFILGVLLVPTAVTFVWFSVFGGTALYFEIYGGGGIADAVANDVSTAIFVTLERLPLSGIVSLLTACVVAVFFVTSSDSASFVVDMLTSGGHPNPPIWQRVFWATAEGACAAVLLYAGGSQALSALQTAVVTIGLPFCIVLVAMCFSLLRSLRQESEVAELAELVQVGPSLALASGGVLGPELSTRETPRSTGADQRLLIPEFRLRRILVPTDYSPSSLSAVGFACQLAERLDQDTQVDLLHVTPPPVDYLPIDEWIWGESREPKQVEDKLKEAAEKALRAYVAALPESVRSRINVRLELGVPYRVILRVAQQEAYDLLVLGTQGRTASQQVRLGSVAERIVRLAPCSVVTVR